MPTVQGTKKNILRGIGSLWLAPYNDTTDTPEPLPAESVALGADWGGNWTHPGYTVGGVVEDYNPKTIQHQVDEMPMPVDVDIDTVDYTFTTELAEATLANFKLAYGGGTIAVTAPATGVIGKSVLTLPDTLAHYTVGLEGKNEFGYWTRIYVPKAIVAGDVKTTWQRSHDYRKVPLTIQSLCLQTEVKRINMTAAAL